MALVTVEIRTPSISAEESEEGEEVGEVDVGGIWSPTTLMYASSDKECIPRASTRSNSSEENLKTEKFQRKSTSRSAEGEEESLYAALEEEDKEGDWQGSFTSSSLLVSVLNCSCSQRSWYSIRRLNFGLVQWHV